MKDDSISTWDVKISIFIIFLRSMTDLNRFVF